MRPYLNKLNIITTVKPYRIFNYIRYIGSIGNRNIGKRSQYYYSNDVNVDLYVPHSQTGNEYDLASLGNKDELLDRMMKYDILDKPLNLVLAKRAIKYFLDQIHRLKFCSFESCIKNLDLKSAIGFGAKSEGVYGRDSPAMMQYFENTIEKCSKQPHIFIINAAQKDELRPSVNGKIKTARLFMSYPPEHTLLASMALGDLMDQFMELRVTTGKSVSFVGDSFQKGALKFIRDRLEEFPYYYDTDTSGQDSSVSAEFLSLFYDLVFDQTDFDNEYQINIFNTVRYNSINKVVNVAGQLYSINRGLGSGDYMTIVINIMWRLYLFYCSYNHNLETVHDDNFIVINGDDFIQGSIFQDLNHDSDFATIEWRKRPSTKEELVFCSLYLYPDIHHDPTKVLDVLNKRLKRTHMLSPSLEMQRLGGILLCHSSQQVHHIIHQRMQRLLIQYSKDKLLFETYKFMYKSYAEIFKSYNTYVQFN